MDNRPNQFLLQQGNNHQNCICSVICRINCLTTLTQRNEQELFREFTVTLPEMEQRSLDEKFRQTLRTVIYGYAWKEKCYQRTGMRSFGCALRAIHPNMDEGERKRQCRKVTTITTIYEGWDDIKRNVTHSDMINVDVRQMSLKELARATKWPNVVQYNIEHAPRAVPRRRVVPKFSEALINTIALHIRENTPLLEQIDGDEAQYRLVGNHIANALSRLDED